MIHGRPSCLLLACAALLAPSAPAATLHEVGAFDLPSVSVETAVSGSLAVVVTEGRLRVVDVSDPMAPEELGSVAVELTDNGAEYNVQVVISGDHAYLVDAYSTMRIFDLSDPAHPAEVGTFDTGGATQDLAVVGDVAYLAVDYLHSSNATGLRLLDVSDPAAPLEIGLPRKPAGFAWFWALSLDVAGDRLYVTGWGKRVAGSSSMEPVFWILDLSQPAAPAELAEGKVNQRRADEVEAALAGIAYVPDFVGYVYWEPGFRVVEASGAAPPSSLAFLGMPFSIDDLEVEDGVAWVASDDVTDPFAQTWTYTARLRLFGLADPQAPSPAGVVDVGETPEERLVHVAVAGSTGYVTWGSGLRVVDASDPDEPVALGSLTEIEDAVDVALVGERAYVANEGMDLRILDVADPAAPVELGFYDGDGGAACLAVAGDLVFLGGANGSGVRVLDVSDPAMPTEVATIPLAGTAVRLRVAGSRLYVAQRLDAPEVSGLRIFDVSDPASPAPLGFLPTGSTDDLAPTDLDVEGQLAYLAAGPVRVIDVSDPELPSEITTWQDAVAVEVVGSRAFLLADPPGGYSLVVADASDPAAPAELGAASLPVLGGTSVRPHATLAVEGDHALVGQDEDVALLDVSDPAHPAVVDTHVLADPTDPFVHGLAVPGRADGEAGLWAVANHLGGVRFLAPEPSGGLAPAAAAGALALLRRRRRSADA